LFATPVLYTHSSPRPVSHFAEPNQLLIVRGLSPPQYDSMADATRRFLWLSLPVGVVLLAIGGYWLSGRSPRACDMRYTKEHPSGFLGAKSAGEAMLRLDAVRSAA